MRKYQYECLANEIISLGDNIYVETMNFQGLSVEISEDVSKTFYVKTYCAITGYVCGYYLKPIYEYDELVTYLTNIKNNVNFDMECDLETELTNVINDYLKRLLG